MTIYINKAAYTGELSEDGNKVLMELESTEGLIVGTDVDIDADEMGYSKRSIESIDGGHVVCALNSRDDDLLQNLRALGVKA